MTRYYVPTDPKLGQDMVMSNRDLRLVRAVVSERGAFPRDWRPATLRETIWIFLTGPRWSLAGIAAGWAVTGLLLALMGYHR